MARKNQAAAKAKFGGRAGAGAGVAMAAALCALLSACGGGGSDGAAVSQAPRAEPGVVAPVVPAQPATPTQPGQSWTGSPSEILPGQVGAPMASGDEAADALNWFNYRRAQSGLAPTPKNQELATAAQGHSNYQALADQIGHGQEAGRPGFTGADPGARMLAAGYKLSAQTGYAYGEVISAASGIGGQGAAEELIAAIYHRFVALEPTFKDGGAGVAASSAGQRYVTVKFGVIGDSDGLGAGRLAVYPTPGQTGLPRWFKSDTEIPDPVPDKNIVGYPVSVHADMGRQVTVSSFTLRLRGEAVDLPARLIARGTDRYAADSAAAIVPLDAMKAGATYDARFEGFVGSEAVSRSWSFTVR